MSQIDEAIKEHRQECSNENSKKHVTWQQASIWLVAIGLSVVGISGTIAFATGKSIQQGKNMAEKALEMSIKTDSAFTAHVIDQRTYSKEVLSGIQEVKALLQKEQK